MGFEKKTPLWNNGIFIYLKVENHWAGGSWLLEILQRKNAPMWILGGGISYIISMLKFFYPLGSFVWVYQLLHCCPPGNYDFANWNLQCLEYRWLSHFSDWSQFLDRGELYFWDDSWLICYCMYTEVSSQKQQLSSNSCS